MHKSRTAFTLVELLTVVAILTVLAAVLFPVFRSGIESAKKSVCASNFRQAYLATYLYMEDYSETFMPINYQPAEPANSKNDRTWVQMVLPYAGSYGIFRCPSDYGAKPKLETAFDQDLVPGDVYSRYYSDSMRTNFGYNYLYLSPVVLENQRWTSQPRQMSSVEDAGKMLLFVDTVWDRDLTGRPVGGGSWLVIPPCRYAQQSKQVIDTFGLVGKEVYAEILGWDVKDELSSLRYGGAWAWHSERTTIVRTDGSTSSVSLKELSSGCNVKENWSGFVQTQATYIWDMR